MAEFDSAEPTMRLLAATQATHDAFTEAACAVAEPGYAAEFARRAEYQGRIALHLRGQQAREGLASDALWHRPAVRPGDSAASFANGDHRVLFDRCLRLMDAATLEFCRVYGPNVARVLSSAMQVAYPVNTTRRGTGMSDWADTAQGAVPGGWREN
jgi:hypothetical protein